MSPVHTSETETTASVASRPRQWFRRPAVLADVAALLSLGGLAGWFWAERADDAVRVPDRVCNGHISGRDAASLLPETGAQFAESSSESVRPSRRSGRWCGLNAGSASVLFSYTQDRAYTADAGAQRARASGDRLIELGPAKGVVRGNNASLYLTCRHSAPRSDQHRGLKVDVDYYPPSQGPVSGDDAKLRLVELAAESMRHVAGELGCDNTAELPDKPSRSS
jgi:hypothetical protein